MSSTKSSQRLLVAAAVCLAFAAGYAVKRAPSAGPGSGRQILYYFDPMNPSLRSSEPGVGSCGMALEPFYADEAGTGPVARKPGTVVLRPERQQLLGVVVAPVAKEPARSTLRLLGRVAPDETRLYRVSAATLGRIRDMGGATTGSLVKKGELLGVYFTQETLQAQQNFLRMYETLERVKETGSNPADNLQGGQQLAVYTRNVEVARQTLLNLGMSPEQLDEIAKTRQMGYLMQIRAPEAGLVTSRAISSGQTFSAGQDLFTIANLSKVWVFADAFQGDEAYLRPGTKAKVRLPGSDRTFDAVVGRVPPDFDADRRALRVRLELANTGLVLRPGMFVDVEVPVRLPPSVTVPDGAVVDSGTRSTVYVEKAPGIFEPRRVRVGRRFGSRVQVVSGLMEGERVAASGTFLLDSESRMHASAVRPVPGKAVDPVCGMPLDAAKARAAGLVSTYQGTPYSFCEPSCKQEFDRDPTLHLEQPK